MGELVPRFRIDDDRFDVTFELVPEGGADATTDVAPRCAEPAAVLRAWRDGLPLVPLDGGGWAPLPRAWLEQHGARVADLLAARREDGKVETAALPALAELCDDARPPAPARATRASRRCSTASSASPTPRSPADLTAELRPYQRHGVDWLSFLREAGLGAVLADDMGLGKTLQTLCALRGRTLVVCPRSVVHNWAAEIARFRPALRASIYHGPRRALDPDADVTLTTYAILRLDAEALAKETWDTRRPRRGAGHQEPGQPGGARRVRAPRRASASRSAARRSRTASRSSGAQLHFTNRGLLGGRSDFDERFARPIADGDAGAAERLRAEDPPLRAAPPQARRRARAAAAHRGGAPRRARRAGARRLRRRARRDPEGGGRTSSPKGGSVLAALEALLRLRQAACHAALVPGQHATTSSKVERLVEALEDVGGRRPQGARLLAVDLAPRPGRAAPRRARASRSRGSTARRAIAPPSSPSSRPRAARP